MLLLKKIPVTVTLITINTIGFIIELFKIPVHSGSEWTLGLLSIGAEFNPYTLDHDWYRIFTHMFLHDSTLHLVFNMYALFMVGNELEPEIGKRKFILVYFITGVASTFTSMYVNLFTIGVGASGAIFGLFGFSLIINISRGSKQGHSSTPLIVNFILFVIINLLFAKAFHGDTPAHLGGAFIGLLLGLISICYSSLRKIKIEYLFFPILILIYFLLPRYQVTYFRFFQQLLATEDSAENIFSQTISDAEVLLKLKECNARWDSTLALLDAHKYIPTYLHEDTFKLKKYISLRKLENAFRIRMISTESYVYRDSIELVQDSMRIYYAIKYPLIMTHKKRKPNISSGQLDQRKTWFDSEWVEVPGPPGRYYRIGAIDSIGRWQGKVVDFYSDNRVQMKGFYKNDLRDGIFLYYSDHNTYTSAGRYKMNESIGKWEFFHFNGKLRSEVYYKDRYFLKNLWDSTGRQMVKDGYGREVEKHPNGVTAVTGEYRDGYKEGIWYGYHENGEMYFEENYYQGKLINGRSKNLQGQLFFYDRSSLFPLPLGGFKKLKEYLQDEAKKISSKVKGTVRVSFLLTHNGQFREIKIDKSLSKELDEKSKSLLLNGPSWITAKEHGQEPRDAYGFIEVEF